MEYNKNDFILMKPGIRKYVCYFIFLLISCCGSYPSIRYSDRDIVLRKEDLNKSGKQISSIRNYDSSYEYSHRSDMNSYPASKFSSKHKQFVERYLSKEFSFSPEAIINNRGVDYLLNGRYKEAGILFREAIKENDKYAPAFNNLGIIFELYNGGDACSMYSKACLLDPENERYIKNFLYFRDKK